MERCIKKHPFHSWSIYAAGKAYCSLEITTLKHFQLFYSFIKILARASINAGKVYFLYKLSYAFHLSSCCLSASTNAWRKKFKTEGKNKYVLQQFLSVTVFFQHFLFLSVLKISFMVSDMCVLSSSSDAIYSCIICTCIYIYLHTHTYIYINWLSV